MEHNINNTLPGNQIPPVDAVLLDALIGLSMANERVGHVARYILDTTLFSCKFIGCRRSELIASAFFIACQTERHKIGWDRLTHPKYTNFYCEKDMKAVARVILEENQKRQRTIVSEMKKKSRMCWRMLDTRLYEH